MDPTKMKIKKIINEIRGHAYIDIQKGKN